MIALRSVRALVAVCAAAFLVLSQAVGASATTTDLINAASTTIAIEAPAPGESQSWNMSVNNAVDSPLPLGLEITGQSAVLFSGPAPMELTVKTPDGVTVVERVPVSQVLGKSLTLPELQSGKSYDLVGTVTLPRAADNSYQGANGTLKFRFVTSLEQPAVKPTAPATGPGLAQTGLNNLFPVLTAAAVLLVLGLGLVVARRKSSTHE